MLLFWPGDCFQGCDAFLYGRGGWQGAQLAQFSIDVKTRAGKETCRVAQFAGLLCMGEALEGDVGVGLGERLGCALPEGLVGGIIPLPRCAGRHHSRLPSGGCLALFRPLWMGFPHTTPAKRIQSRGCSATHRPGFGIERLNRGQGPIRISGSELARLWTAPRRRY